MHGQSERHVLTTFLVNRVHESANLTSQHSSFDNTHTFHTKSHGAAGSTKYGQ